MRDVVVSQSIKYSIHRVFIPFRVLNIEQLFFSIFNLNYLTSPSLGWQQTFFSGARFDDKEIWEEFAYVSER